MPYVNSTPKVVRNARRNPALRDRRTAHHGWFQSWKLNTDIAYRGLLSFDFLSLAEAHPLVEHTSAEVEPISWWNGSTWEAYYPLYSIAVKTGQPRTFRLIDVDVMYDHELDKARFERIRREYRELGSSLIICTEKTLRLEPRRTNAKFILSHAGDGIVTQEEKAMVRRFAMVEPFSVNQVVKAAVLDYPRAYSTVLNMVAAGELRFALNRRFDGDTRVWRRGR